MRLVADFVGFTHLDDEDNLALVDGRPIQLFRTGPLFDRLTGELTLDITPEVLASFVLTFRGPIPLDWNHGSAFPAAGPEGGSSLGEITEVFATAAGLFGVPRYTERGLAALEASSPVLFTSPEFVLGEVFDRGDGERLGEHQLLAVALTNRPRQDNLERVTLADSAYVTYLTTTSATRRLGVDGMADKATITAPDVEAVADTTELDELRAQCEALQAELAALKEPAPEAQALSEAATDGDVARVVALGEASGNAAVKMLAEQVTTLAGQVTNLEKNRHDDAKHFALSEAVDKGWIAPTRKGYFGKLFDADAALFAEAIKHAKANPAVTLGRLSHAEAPNAPTPESEAAEVEAECLKLAEEGKSPFEIFNIQQARLAGEVSRG